MRHIVLTPEQLQVVLEAEKPIEVRDPQGRTVAHLAPLHPADVEAIERSKQSRNSGESLVPSDQVQAHLRRLEEIRRQEGLDETKMLDLLRRLRAGEKV